MTKNASLSLDNFVPYRMSVASNSMSDVIASAYRSLFGLNVAEWRLIAVLAEQQPITQNDLCAATGMDKVMVSRAAIALTGRGLVQRTPHPDDRRSHMLSLTDSGHALYAQVVPKALALEKDLLADFTNAEIADFVAMLRRLQARAEQMSGAEG